MSRLALVVDDSPTLRSMVNKTFRSMKFEVIEGADGQEALNAAKSRSDIDIVVTDLNMPNMDGIAFIRQLRKIPHYQFTPVLLLTTETSVAQKEKAKQAGATGWLTKPFEPQKLQATVRRVLP